MADGTAVEPLDGDVRDPSMFFVVYETGDNTTSAEGEATPLDLFYSRATNWGDFYDVVEKEVDGEIVEEWDWLEHDRDDLSGEASVTANPGGTFFYSVWNQWKEDEYEHVFDSDMIFRRVMYLDNVEATATAQILFVSATAASFDEEVTFIGSAHDNDHVGALPHEAIVEYEWTSDIQGLLSTEQSFSRQAGQSPGQLWRGFHTISFRAKDDEGKWSRPVTTRILVAEQIFTTYVPIILR
jgi:hypothetical protein